MMLVNEATSPDPMYKLRRLGAPMTGTIAGAVSANVSMLMAKCEVS